MNVLGLRKLPNGDGGYGSCYILDNNTLYKKFHKMDDGTYPFEADYFDKFIGVKSDSFVFPKDITVDGDYAIGYTMDYIHADTLEVMDFDFSINDFIVALDRLKEGIYKVTNSGIVICDVNAKNMLYDGEFHVIDTDLYMTTDECDFDPYDVNEDYVASYLYSYITEEKCSYEMGMIRKYNYELDKLDREMRKGADMESLKHYLYELQNSVEELSERRIDTFNDLYKVMKRIK